MDEKVEIVRATSQVDREAVFRIRREVFVVEQDVDSGLEFDGLDDDALLVLARLDGKPIGCFRIVDEGDGVAHPGRLAVVQEWRGHGFGKVLMRACLEVMREEGYVEAVIHAQAYLEDFYKEFGFVREGDFFMEAGIKHILMRKMF